MMYIPTKPLNRFIEKFWVIHDDALEYSAKVFPDGVIQLIINLGAPYSVLCPHGSEATFRFGSLSGERTCAWSVKQDRSCHAIGIRFRQGGAYPFFGIPLHLIANTIVDIELLWGASFVERLRDRLFTASSPASQCLFLVQALLEKAGYNPQTNSIVDMALQYMANTEEPCIRDIASNIGISHKHLLRQFDKFVGITPKALVRIRRFQRSLKLLTSYAESRLYSSALPLSMTEIAYEACYYDQSHFVHDFESFTGMTPSSFVHYYQAQQHRLFEPEYAPIRYYRHNLVTQNA
ncbi:MAG: helix-turn-helix domain-containing protein [Bacteroidota bacterium]|nr:helix-turn-helix domain-containing protein [Candidatus Kapabacteria bacterium]MDW8219198.1 helix-turn-helix domain-containing protein [Bacteroidota bacterium]